MFFSVFEGNFYLEVHSVFLDLSKAFDKVSHNVLLNKLKINGINGNVFELTEPFFHSRCQYVVLNGQYSSQHSIRACLLQGSVLGLLLF